MINIMKADLYRIRKSKMFWVSIIISMISAVGIAFLLHLAEIGTISKEVTVNFSLLVDSFFVYFLGTMLIGKFISKDFETKNIHDEIASGNGRISIVLAKTVSSAIIVLAITLPYALTAIIGFCMNLSCIAYVGIPSVFYTILSNQDGFVVNGANIVKCISICLLVLLVYMARLSVCIPVAFKTRKIIPVMITGIVCSFVFDLLYSMVSDVEAAAHVIKMLPYCVTYDLGLGASTSTCMRALGSSIIFLILITFITHKVFHKSEIK